MNPYFDMQRAVHNLKLSQGTINLWLGLAGHKPRNLTVNARLCLNESKISPNSCRAGPSFGLIQAAD